MVRAGNSVVDLTRDLDETLVAGLRASARGGESPAEMFRSLKGALGGQPHILTLLEYFRQAFGLSLAEVKPIAALSRTAERELENDSLLNDLLAPAIGKRRPYWDGDGTRT